MAEKVLMTGVSAVNGNVTPVWVNISGEHIKVRANVEISLVRQISDLIINILLALCG
jgi:hypothetical protein